LSLILSDGLTPSAEHDDIRRLLREAMEERIMIVFIVMDDSANKKRDSVLNLRKVQFVKDALGNTTGEMKMEYYLDSFPFQYYLIVHNLEDLPGALAGLLRTWFAEVNT
jgi:midasin